MEPKLHIKPFLLLLTIGIIINGLGFFNGIMLTDGMLYALIAKNMVVHDDYLFLTLNGMDWLDKPHFPFWCAALSYKLFGINAFAYKLPAFLFWLAGLAYTYAFSKKEYGTQIARIAVLVYVATLHLIVSNNDVRAEPYLTGMIMASMYHFYRVYSGNSLRHLVLASLWAAAAVMTKGIFVLIVIGGGFVVAWLVRKEWRQFANFRWYLALVLIFLFISPELYSLYVQFDARPDTHVFGQTNVSGIKFFFWDSQFGRFVNSGPIKGSGDPFFYVHTLLWAFLPWSLLLPIMVYFSVKKNKGIRVHPLIWGTVVITFLLFSASRFQLPHYLNIIFPHLAIWLGVFLHRISKSPYLKVAHRIQWSVGVLLSICLLALSYFFHAPYWWAMALVVIAVGVTVSLLSYKPILYRLVLNGTLMGLLVGLFYGIYLYPGLLSYQAGDAAARYVDEHPKVKKVNLLLDEVNNLAFCFHSDAEVNIVAEGGIREGMDVNVPLIVHENRLEEVRPYYDVAERIAFDDYHVSKIKPRFYYFRTREEALGKLYLVDLKQKNN